ncbi:MAG: PilZ domain-containing protein [Pseudomonadota bacterium]
MSEQRRQYLRLPVESTTFIEVEAPSANQEDKGRLVTCKTLNVSRGGIQVSLGEALTQGAILQIGIDLPGAETTLYLAGEVRWCLPELNSNDCWLAGFKLLNADHSDIVAWHELLEDMER